MKKYLPLVLAALVWTGLPSEAQTISGCASVAVNQIAKSTNKVKLQADIDCFEKAVTTARESQRLRQNRLNQLAPVVTPAPVPTPTPTPTPVKLSGVLDEGDSISILWGGNHTGIYTGLHPDVKFSGKAVGGSSLGSMAARFEADAAEHPQLVTILIGANDIPAVGLDWYQYKTPEQYTVDLFNYTTKWKATGAKVLVGTILPQCIPNADNVRTNNNADAINKIIRASKVIDGVIDYAADPEMGDKNAPCGKVLYNDGLHPSDGGSNFSGGQGKLARVYDAAVDKALGIPAHATATAPVTTGPEGIESITPIASNFDIKSFISPGYGVVPPSNVPDVVGAFRFICQPGQMNYDDPILYPGVKGGSMHLHQWYGNTEAKYDSTYPSIRATGESTCSNKLNRSAYWIPAMMNSQGLVIKPDYLSIYYKRIPKDSPGCFLAADKGCVDLPAGLKVVSGYDMKRMGQTQNENLTFSHRCISPDKPSVHRSNLADAIADCGGEGQIMAAINFGNCWNGKLDSPDHRSHLVHPQYIGNSYSECPATHPYLIPELTQQIAYTIKKSDGQVYFSSDRTGGMNMQGGTTFHADYMEGWEPTVRATWERTCINQMLNCSDGVLGDSTMLLRGNNSYTAEPRLVEAPKR
jgi:lysophospholipase L1-like esterase